MPTRLELLQEMLQKEPEDSFLNYAIALEYAKDDIPKAIKTIEDILKRDENYLGAYYQLGQFYEQVNDTEKAGAIYKKGIEIAKQQKNNKTLGELNEALLNLEE